MLKKLYPLRVMMTVPTHRPAVFEHTASGLQHTAQQSSRMSHNIVFMWVRHAGIDVSRILTPAATLRPGAAQTCQTKQDHGLETGLDLPELIGACASALPDDGAAPQPVYYETTVCNVRACLASTLT